MNVLAVAYDLPPTLAPQAIQIGRLLRHVPEDVRLYVAGADYATPNRLDAYPELAARFEGRVSVSSIFASRTLGLRMRLAPLLFRLPEPCAYDMRALYQAIVEKWSSVRFDWIWTFAYPFSSHVLGRKLKERFGCRWLAHTSDPWADNPLLGYGFLSGPFNARLERRAFDSADRLVFVSEETRDFYAAKYPGLAPRMGVVEHAYDPRLYDAAAPRRGPVFVMRYLGNIYGGRSPETMLKALAELKRRTSLAFKLELVLSYPRALEALIRRHGLQDVVTARPAVDYVASLKLMRSADLLVTFENPLPSASFPKNLFFPSKLADYMGARRPILALAGEGTTRRVVERYGGRAADPGDPEAIVRLLEDFLARWKSGEDFQPKGGLEAYSAENKAREFMELVR